MEIKEFKIESRQETFRTTKVSPIDLLAISGQIDFKKFDQAKNIITFALEHLEVQVADTKWLPVKTKDREIYWPTGIDEDMNALQELTIWYLTNIIIPAFMKSSESQMNTL